MARFVYTGDARREISFPLGGIGSGCIGLDGTGRLRDWEIYNRPNKGSINGYSHFGIKAERAGRTLDARVMNADLMPPYTGTAVPGSMFGNYGFGPSRYLLGGVPHFRDSEFVGEFPFCQVNFKDDSFPGRVALKGFNPFIPLEQDDSSLPAAFFTACVTNTTPDVLSYTVALSLNNPMKGRRFNRLVEEGPITAMVLTNDNEDGRDPEYGQLAMAVETQPGISCQQYWYRGGWYDNLGIFWQDFTAPGPLKNRVYGEDAPHGNVNEDIATLAVSVTLAPGEQRELKFLVAWNYPNCYNYWNGKCEAGCVPSDQVWKNYYATQFASALETLRYAMANWDRLLDRTRLFHRALYGSSLPDEALEALTANLSLLKSPTVLRLEDGSFYGWEGCHCSSGCCEGSCTHVWNYAFALPFLFPKLERSLRELDYTFNLREDGGMPFRLQLPLGSPRSSFRPCVDGQMGGVIKTYREWKISGDTQWLARWWPLVKKSLEFAWSPTNADRWDPEKSGVITGRQHHTLDMELFGPSSWLNGFYLAALKAGAEMARALGDVQAAEEYLRLYEQGRAYTDRELFNGEYYHQKVDIRDKSVLMPFADGSTLTGGATVDTYWNEEAGQLKYQIAEGCGIDQVLAQWMSDLCGLGDVLDHQQVNQALSAVFRHNYKESFRNHFNPCRIFGLNDEAGAVICDWPEGKEKPVVPIPYAEESMHGFEYQAASHMIARGLIDEGMKIVASIRDRYDGEKRNPWNEFECGSNYARSMASYALLISFSGFRYDMTRGRVGFLPVRELPEQRFFWSLEGGWGDSLITREQTRLSVLSGQIFIQEFVVPQPQAVRELTVNGKIVRFSVCQDALVLEAGVQLHEGDLISARY